MKRPAHLLLALLLGLLLQAGLAAAGSHSTAGAVGACGTAGEPADPLHPFSRDLVPSDPPLVAGAWPEPFAAAGLAWRPFAAARHGNVAWSAVDPFFPSRPVYLTTQRLRL